MPTEHTHTSIKKALNIRLIINMRFLLTLFYFYEWTDSLIYTALDISSCIWLNFEIKETFIFLCNRAAERHPGQWSWTVYRRYQKQNNHDSLLRLIGCIAIFFFTLGICCIQEKKRIAILPSFCVNCLQALLHTVSH